MGNTSAKLLLIGLDNAGKSTILARIIEPNTAVNGITPTIGYKKDKFTRSGIDF
jgi:GTPase SAR1 family protein